MWVERHVIRHGTDVLVMFLFIAAIGSDAILSPSLPPVGTTNRLRTTCKHYRSLEKF
jgi:hypothetical protein